jgi:ELWxxDGT repeat protein
MASIRSLTLALTLASLGAAAPARADLVVLKDTRPGTANGASTFLGAAGTKAYFVADDGVNGRQLWVTDGTTAGTAMTAPVIGSTGSVNDSQRAGALGDAFLLKMNDGLYGAEPWRSDGSAGGTFRVSDIRPGSPDSDPANWTRFGAKMLFRAVDTANFTDALWITDGVTATRSGGDAIWANASARAAGILGGYVYYVNRNRLMRTAAVVGDATLVATLPNTPQDMLVVNDRIYFALQDAASDVELWSSDGTGAGTARLKDIVPGAASGSPQQLTRVDDRVFFSAIDAAGGRELWVSDGTDAGTVRVKDIRPGIQSSNPDRLVALGGKLYFAADDGAHGRELWVSDGTDAGTTLVKDFVSGSGSGFGNVALDTIQVAGGRLLLMVDTDLGFSISQPWASDGTDAGTQPLSAIAQNLSAFPPFVANSGMLYTVIQRADIGDTVGREPYAMSALTDLGPSWCESSEDLIGDQQTTTTRFTLPAGIKIADLDVSVDLFHGDLGDLSITLTHVGDTAVTLLNLSAARTCSAKELDIRFDSGAAADVDASCASGSRLAYPHRSAWRPTASLAAFVDHDLGGTWELAITDARAGNAGVLHGLCLTATAKQTADPIFGDGFE